MKKLYKCSLTRTDDFYVYKFYVYAENVGQIKSDLRAFEFPDGKWVSHIEQEKGEIDEKLKILTSASFFIYSLL